MNDARISISSTQVNKAGKHVRDWLLGRTRATNDAQRHDDALRTILGYRDSFTEPLEMVTNKLRVAVSTMESDATPTVAARPKTFASIALKLRKLSIRLTQIEDIAGCRVVLPSLNDVYELVDIVSDLWPEAVIDDKNKRPNPGTGYRAIHIIVEEAGRKVEIQVRTERQGRWADTVEEWGKRLSIDRPDWNLKDGQGPEDLVLYFRLAADRLARLDAGQDLDPKLEQQFETIRAQVLHYFTE